MAVLRRLLAITGTTLVILVTGVGMAGCSAEGEPAAEAIHAEAAVATPVTAEVDPADAMVEGAEAAENGSEVAESDVVLAPEDTTGTETTAEAGMIAELEVMTQTEAVTETVPAESPVEEVIIKRGEFVIAEENTPASGQAMIVRKPDGSHVVRLDENFSVFQGPDLFVIIPHNPEATASVDIEAGGYTNLGALQAISGEQEYALPAEVDADSIGHVIVYCRAFTITFAVAAMQ